MVETIHRRPAKPRANAKAPEWANIKHLSQWRTTPETFANPVICSFETVDTPHPATQARQRRACQGPVSSPPQAGRGVVHPQSSRTSISVQVRLTFLAVTGEYPKRSLEGRADSRPALSSLLVGNAGEATSISSDRGSNFGPFRCHRSKAGARAGTFFARSFGFYRASFAHKV
jgi:hypothetical protein